jgi:hypothetical protein
MKRIRTNHRYIEKNMRAQLVKDHFRSYRYCIRGGMTHQGELTFMLPSLLVQPQFGDPIQRLARGSPVFGPILSRLKRILYASM